VRSLHSFPTRRSSDLFHFHIWIRVNVNTFRFNIEQCDIIFSSWAYGQQSVRFLPLNFLCGLIRVELRPPGRGVQFFSTGCVQVMNVQWTLICIRQGPNGQVFQVFGNCHARSISSLGCQPHIHYIEFWTRSVGYSPSSSSSFFGGMASPFSSYWTARYFGWFNF